MNRKLLLLCNPGIVGQNYVAHVPAILERYRRYFMSPVGGYWCSDEIDEMPAHICDCKAQITWLATKLAEYNKSSIDYSMIVFVGHGGAVFGHDYLQLSSGGRIKVLDLLPTNKEEASRIKRCIIIDACRTFVGAAQDRILLESKSFSGDDMLEGEDCRDLYNKYIANVAPHTEILQSTQYGEPAWVTSGGSAFSDALFDVLQDEVPLWNNLALGDRNGQCVRTVNDILPEVRNKMGESGQVPEFTSLPSSEPFPFYAVWRPVTRYL